MSKAGKLSEDKSKASKQPKLTVYQVRGEAQKANDDMAEKGGNGVGELGDVKTDAILATIDSIKTEFSTRFDGIMEAINATRKEISDCSERVSQAEVRISSAEDDVANLQAKVKRLESKNKTLEEKLLDFETRSRLNNLRLVELPEGAEGQDTCSFLEK